MCIIFESMHSIFALPGWHHECILKKEGVSHFGLVFRWRDGDERCRWEGKKKKGMTKYFIIYHVKNPTGGVCWLNSYSILSVTSACNNKTSLKIAVGCWFIICDQHLKPNMSVFWFFWIVFWLHVFVFLNMAYSKLVVFDVFYDRRT